MEPGIGVVTAEPEVPVEISMVYYNNVLNSGANEDSKGVDIGETYLTDSRDSADPSHLVDLDLKADPLHIEGPVPTAGPVNTRIIEYQNIMELKSTANACNICEFTAINTKYLKYHKRKVHYVVPSKCIVCSKVCASKSNLNVHMQSIHNISDIRRKSTDTVDAHVASENPVNVDLNNVLMLVEKNDIEPHYKCDKCTFIGKNVQSLKTHKQRTHLATKHKCILCHYYADHKKYLKKHMIREHKKLVHSIVKL